jgi:universal stress protein E
MKLFKKILYVTEPTVEQGQAIARAVSLAENNQADLTVMEVVAGVPAGIAAHLRGADPDGLQADALHTRRSELENLVAPYRKQQGIRVEVLTGQVFAEAIRAVSRDGYDLLIKPAENPAFIERLFGSTDMHLLRKCPCPVWITRPDDRPNYECVLAAVDFDLDRIDGPEDEALTRQIVEIASSLAISDFASLHLVHVWDAPGEMTVRSWANNPAEAGMLYAESERVRHDAAFARLSERMRERLGTEAFDHLAPRFHLRKGAATKVIPETAKELQAEVLVMGTLARRGIAGLLIGNTAETILEQVQCSVLAVKPDGFASPITLEG